MTESDSLENGIFTEKRTELKKQLVTANFPQCYVQLLNYNNDVQPNDNKFSAGESRDTSWKFKFF